MGKGNELSTGGKNRKKWGVCVDSTCFTEVTREATEDQWDADDIRHDSSIQGARPCSDHEHADVVVAFEPKQGMEVYLVVVRRSTGDSFHREEGLMEVVAAFSDKRLALWAAESIQISGEANRLGFFAEDGGLDTIHVSWSGYFESLDSVDVQAIELGAPKPERKNSSRR